jgi:hypothetical protein
MAFTLQKSLLHNTLILLRKNNNTRLTGGFLVAQTPKQQYNQYMFNAIRRRKMAKMKLYFGIIATLVVGVAQACPQGTATVRNMGGQTTAVITPANPSGTVSRITTPSGQVTGYVNHSTGRITSPSGATTGYVKR